MLLLLLLLSILVSLSLARSRFRVLGRVNSLHSSLIKQAAHKPQIGGRRNQIVAQEDEPNQQ